MAKSIQRPTVHYLRTIYLDYAKKLLEAHPEWWSKYEKRLKQKYCYIYAKEGNKIVLKMSWHIWKETVESYFHKAKDAIIQGECLTLGHGMGKIQAIRIERNFNKRVVNWNETYKANLRTEDNKLKRIFYTDEDYCRIAWLKGGFLPNETSYNFDPAERNMASGKGFKIEFVRALKQDPLLKYRYKYYPLKIKQCSTHSALSEE